MYATCLHCAARLGTNDAIEALPIGRRVAFDQQHGRLWVVCRRCERWNLTPFDERWEALEQCERAFRATRVRVSGENIGLARLHDGTELVRVGKPQRPEFAAWRYGDQFGRRRRRNWTIAGGTLAGVGLAASGLMVAGAGVGALLPLLHVAGLARLLAEQKKQSHAPLQRDDGTWIAPLGSPRLIELAGTPDTWGIDIGIWASGPTRDAVIPTTWIGQSQAEKNEIGRAQITGTSAIGLLRRALPRINRAGATGAVIRDGVRLIEDAGGPDQFARWATMKRREWASKSSFGDTGDLAHIPVAARLAFEMSLHEDSERRAMDGELATLTRAWQEAAEIAGVADALAVPARVQAALTHMKNESASQ